MYGAIVRGSTITNNLGTGLVINNPYIIDSNVITNNQPACSITYAGGITPGNFTNNIISGTNGSYACYFQSFGAQFYVAQNKFISNTLNGSAVIIYHSCRIF